MKQGQQDGKDAEHILVVEDSPTQAEQLRHLLETTGFSVDWVGSGEEALAWLERQRPIIIISDVVMAGMDGFELCRRIKTDEDLRYIPVILLTNLSEPGDIMKGLACQADNFITKPYDKQVLLSRIDYLLANLNLRKTSQHRSPEMGIEIFFGGQKHRITADRMQIIDLLISTYDVVLQKNAELERMNKQLQEANDNIKTLRGIIPICASCKKIRNDQGYWEQVENYIRDHTEANFSHGICAECARRLYPEIIHD